MTIPGGKPVIALTALLGQTPRSPVTTVEPVFVTAEPPRTAKLVAVPNVVWANAGEEIQRSAASPSVARRVEQFGFIRNLLLPFASDPKIDGVPAEERLLP
jgi:hypothetical protein